jgi:hypothetical protein
MREHRWIAAALVALPLVLVAILLLSGRQHLFAALDVGAVARVRIDHGRDHLELARAEDGWRIESAAGAPADDGRIEALLNRLARVTGTPGAPPSGPGAPMELRLMDATGQLLAGARLRPGAGQPFGPQHTEPAPWLRLRDLPPLPVWPSAWTSLRPPAIRARTVVAVEQLGVEGPRRLERARAEWITKALEGLTVRDFRAAAEINWHGAQLYRLHLAGGGVIDVQAVPAAGGGSWVRLTSDTMAAVRAARRFAFRTPQTI